MYSIPTPDQMLAALELASTDEIMISGTTGEGFAALGVSDIEELSVFLLLNDTFAYACADGETIPWDQVVILRDIYKSLDQTEDLASKALVHWAQYVRGYEVLPELREWLEAEPRVPEATLTMLEATARLNQKRGE